MSSTREPYPSAQARLAAVRRKEKLTQVEFATRLGITSRAYLNYELGLREAPASVLYALYEEFDVDAEWVLKGPGDVPPSRAAKRLDEAKLHKAIVDILQYAKELPDLPPSKKLAEAVLLHYGGLVEQGENASKHIERMVRLAA